MTNLTWNLSINRKLKYRPFASELPDFINSMHRTSLNNLDSLSKTFHIWQSLNIVYICSNRIFNQKWDYGGRIAFLWVSSKERFTLQLIIWILCQGCFTSDNQYSLSRTFHIRQPVKIRIHNARYLEARKELSPLPDFHTRIINN